MRATCRSSTLSTATAASNLTLLISIAWALAHTFILLTPVVYCLLYTWGHQVCGSGSTPCMGPVLLASSSAPCDSIPALGTSLLPEELSFNMVMHGACVACIQLSCM